MRGSSMAMAALALCLPLAACMTTDEAAAPTASAIPSAVAGSSARSAGPSAGPSSGPRGGAVTAAAQGEPVEVPPDPVMQARADCWMLVEGKKEMRGIDQRVAFVDKCVAGKMKGGKP